MKIILLRTKSVFYKTILFVIGIITLGLYGSSCNSGGYKYGPKQSGFRDSIKKDSLMMIKKQDSLNKVKGKADSLRKTDSLAKIKKSNAIKDTVKIFNPTPKKYGPKPVKYGPRPVH